MNKILSAIIGGALGVTLVTSVSLGIGVGSNNKATKANAADTPFSVTFDFEDSSAHRASGNNSYSATAKTYTENNTNITLTYADSVTTGSPLTGSANVMGRIAKNTTKSPVVTIGPLSLTSGSVVTGVSYNTKGANTMKMVLAYSTNGTSWTTWQTTNNMPTSKTAKTVSNKSVSTTSFYLKWTVTVSSSTNSNRDFQLDDVVINGTSPDGGTVETYDVTDYITRPTTGIDNGVNRYSDWSNARVRSSALYAGKSAGSNNSIQLNTKNKDSAIISTTSGGSLKSVEINFNSNTNETRKVIIYGSNTAYTSPADLYESETRGDKIGEVSFGSQDTVVYTTSSYQYVGIKSNDSAVYLDSVIVTWTSETEPESISSIEVTNNPTTSFFAVGQPLDFSGLEVTGHFPSGDRVTSDYVLSREEGSAVLAGDVGTLTITVTSRENNQKTDSFSVTVVDKYPVSMDRSAPAVYSSTMKLNEGTARFKVIMTDGSELTNIQVGDTNTVLTIGGQTVDPNSNAVDYINQNATITYTLYNQSVSYTFKILIEDDLVVDHFDDVPEYVLSGESANIVAHFTSFIGMPAVTVEALETDNLSVAFNSSNVTLVDGVGVIPFTVTAGSTTGQFSVVVTIEKDGEIATNSCSIIVRESAPGHEGSGDYELITSMSDLTDGSYVIAAVYNETYHGMRSTIQSSRFDASTLTVENNLITSSSSDYDIFTITAVDGGYTIKSGDKFVAYTGSSTNISLRDDSYVWNISTSSAVLGTFRVLSSTASNRALAYKSEAVATPNNCFAAYSTSNLTAAKAGTGYCEIELFKYNKDESSEDTGAAEFELVKTFVDTYMHMDDIAISDISDTGACRGEGGYYLTAKAAWYEMVTNYTNNGGTHSLKDIFQERFPDAYERYITWAAKNGDSDPWTGSTIASANAYKKPLGDNSASVMVVVVVSVLSLTTLAGYFLFRKRIHK